MELPNWMNPWAPGGAYDKALGGSPVGKAAVDQGNNIWTQYAQPRQAALNTFDALGANPNIRDYDKLQAMNQGWATATRDNPYSMIIANQTRPAQMALLQQMQAQAAGPSVAGAQAQAALGQNASAALGAMGRGPLAARAALAQQAGIGGGIAGDAASARLQEGMNQQRGMFGLASGMRGNDLRAAQDQAQGALAAQALQDQARRFGFGQGMGLEQAQNRAALEYYKMLQQLAMQNEANQLNAVKGAANTGATVMSTAGL